MPCVSSILEWEDYWGAIKVRWGAGRMGYRVDPGLYALGQPDKRSPVLVSANYKLSFDGLRSALPGRSAWILVLDTRGINVWCAAGKGTFGTEELVRRIESVQLGRIVSHRDIIVPQLGAPGIAAHQVKKLCGFKVHYGPVCAKDLPRFLDAGMESTPEMRRKTFPTWDRAVLIPVELVGALKYALFILPVLFVLSGLGRGAGGFVAGMLHHGTFMALSGLGGIAAGAVLTPLLLPWLPGRAFSLKGLNAGALTAVIVAAAYMLVSESPPGGIEILALSLLSTAVSTYLGMNFTGASTYTSLSGVRREMRWALPLEICLAAVGLVLWVASCIAA